MLSHEGVKEDFYFMVVHGGAANLLDQCWRKSAVLRMRPQRQFPVYLFIVKF